MALPQPPPPPPPQTATCFRHPGREAGRRCTRCGRRGVQRVPRPGVGRQPLRRVRPCRPPRRQDPGPLLERPPADAGHVHPDRHQHRRLRVDRASSDPQTMAGDLVPDLDRTRQFDIGAEQPLPRAQGEWYRLVTSGFLHFGIIHLAFNMLLLFQLGQLLEPEIGRIRFALLYFAALLAGSAGVVLLDPAGADRRSVRCRVRTDGRGVHRPAQPRRQPVDDGTRHGPAAEPDVHVHDGPASRSVVTSAD